MRRVTWIDHLRYRFDNIMARGTVALIGSLAVVSALFIVGVAAVVWASGIAPANDQGEMEFSEIAWRSLLRTLDPGTMGGDSGSASFLLAMLVVTLGGIFIVSMLIGVITSGIERRLDDMRKGRSFVVEHDHTLILGWSPQIFSIISELVTANASRPSAAIVVLADQDKVEMEDEIRRKAGHTGRTRIVCRTGSPLDMADLEIANPDAARSIIILASDRDAPDTHTIKTMLALLNNPKRKPEPYHVIADIRDRENLSAARIVGRDEAQLLLGRELISALTVQTGRQPGLSAVYSELLSFAGNEIYFKSEPTLVGQTFGRALFAYEDSALIGLHSAQAGTRLNPPIDTPIAADDQLIVIAEDDDRIRLSGLADYSVDGEAIQAPPQRQRAPERTLVLGWNRHGSSMLGALDEYVAPGSTTMVVADEPAAEKRVAASHTSLANQTVSFQLADTTDRAILDALEVPTYDHVMVLSYSNRLEVQEADARTLVTLLHLRDMAERHGKRFSIVSEMLDLRNRQLAEATKADDFIVSDHLVSLMLAQISENKHLTSVFAELVDPEGMEIYLKPAEDYVRLQHAVSFYTVLEAAQRRGEVALGYRLVGGSRREAGVHGVVINPRKSERVAFAAGDKMILVAES